MAKQSKYVETRWGPIPRESYEHLEFMAASEYRIAMLRLDFRMFLGRVVPSFILALVISFVPVVWMPEIHATGWSAQLHFSTGVIVMATLAAAVGVIWIVGEVVFRFFRWRYRVRYRQTFEAECRTFRKEQGQRVDEERRLRKERREEKRQEERRKQEPSREKPPPEPAPIAETLEELEALAKLKGPSEPI